MANTYSSLFYHLVFSTKERRRFLKPNVESRIWDFIGGIARHNGLTPIRVGGIEDHIHALLLAPPKYSVSQIAKFIKADSSRWIKSELGYDLFSWQDGYAAFSVSKRTVPKVRQYIEEQRIHHGRMSFENEYRQMLNLHEIDIGNEEYLFG
ncbi:MAG TPA: IS200/IS605 family transposase [Aridibacter sp.]|nr:IS200/IS605 family transposase [Aridibacter sp.]